MAVRDEEAVEESAEPAGVFVVMAVRVLVPVVMAVRVVVTVCCVVMVVFMIMRVPMVVCVPGPMVMGVVILVRALFSRSGLFGRADGPGVLVCVLHAAPLSLEVWWWRGVPPRACSAWKIASATNWRACSFSSR